jgi:threonine dehydrogenase-like Zn-dependent dehydrogenase
VDPYEATHLATGARLYEAPFGNRMALGGFDVVYDCVGKAATVGESLRLARAGGAVVLVGMELAPLEVDLTPVWYQEVDLVGVLAHGSEDWEGRRRQDLDIVMGLLADGQLGIEGLVTHRFPLARWREAVATAEDKRSGAVRVLLDYR